MTMFAFLGNGGIPFGGGQVPNGHPLPKDAVPLPAGAGIEAIKRLRWTGEAWEDRPIEESLGPSADDLAERVLGELRKAKLAASGLVNAAIDEARRRFQTQIAGQAELYAEKSAEAAAYVARVANGQAAPDLAAFPRMQAEVGITAETPWQLAQVWLWKSDQALAFRDESEPLRLSALTTIASAPDLDAVEAAQWAFSSALQSLLFPEMEP